MSTLDQIAAAVGCSTATVSRALNASGSVSRTVREDVFRAARKLGYRVPGNGKDRKTVAEAPVAEVLLCRVTPVERLTVTEGGVQIESAHLVEAQEFLSPDYSLSRSFDVHVLEGIVDELQVQGWRASVQLVHGLTDEATLRMVGASAVRGVLVLGEYASDLDRFVGCCPRPLMLVDQILPQVDVSSVGIDNMGGISLAFEHLMELGHRKIGYVGPISNPCFAERRKAFLFKAAGAGLTLLPEWVCETPTHIAATATVVEQLLRGKSRPTAIICASDFVALGSLRAAAAVGLSVPADLSVVGFDGTEVASSVTPPLTTVRVPTVDMGRAAVRLLLSEVQYGRLQTRSGLDVRLKTHLIQGGTTLAKQGRTHS